MNTLKLIAACALLASASTLFAHENTGHDKHSGHAAPQAQTDFGIAGQASAHARRITVQMSDDMRFSPSHITVKKGETLRLQVLNQGQVLHEIVLGTAASLAAHAQQMQAQPGMAHDAPYMAHVAPSEQGELLWQFNRAGEFEFACLVAGHFEAGMHGRITVTP